jgi:ribA/ribD-fused uncharacterized protein
MSAVTSTASSVADLMKVIAKLEHAVETLSAEHADMRSRLLAALGGSAAPAAAAAPKKGKGKKAAAAAAADGASDAESTSTGTTGKKRGRKPRDPADKPVCPPAADGVIRYYSSAEGEYKCFSPFATVKGGADGKTAQTFEIGGKTYISVENYIQSMKFAGVDDEYAEQIRTQKNPALTRRMGETKKHTARSDWDAVKVDFMRAGILAKFQTFDDLAAKLLATGDATIEDESPEDDFWGIGVSGTGANWRGKLLMEVRDLLRDGDDEEDEEDEE